MAIPATITVSGMVVDHEKSVGATVQIQVKCYPEILYVVPIGRSALVEPCAGYGSASLQKIRCALRVRFLTCCQDGTNVIGSDQSYCQGFFAEAHRIFGCDHQ